MCWEVAILMVLFGVNHFLVVSSGNVYTVKLTWMLMTSGWNSR